MNRRRGIGLLTLGGAVLLAAGLAFELEWLATAAAGLGLAAGLLGWLARPAVVPAPLPAPRAAMADMAPLMRELAEEMVRLKRDSAEASRGMAEARASGARMVQAAAGAIARLDESAETSAIAARALAMLPGIADSHAQRIELMAARAEQALALVPETLALPPVFDAVVARLEGIALPDTGALRDAVERLDRLPGEIGQAMHGSLAEAHDAAAALLDQAASRIEAARPDPLLAVGLMEATERLDALAAPMGRANEAAGAWAATAEQRDRAITESLARLASVQEETARIAATLDGLARPQAALGQTLAQLENLPAETARIAAALDGLVQPQAAMAENLARLTTLPEETARMAAAVDGLAQPHASIAETLARLDDLPLETARITAALNGLAQPQTIMLETLARFETAFRMPAPELDLVQPLRAECDRLAGQLTDALGGLPLASEALQGQLATLATLLEPMVAASAALPPMTESAQRATEALLRAAQANIALAARAREAPSGAGAENPPPLMAEEPTSAEPTAPRAAPAPPATQEPISPQPAIEPPGESQAVDSTASANPARPPRLLENLDETIRGLQSLSSAIAAAAERRLENAA